MYCSNCGKEVEANMNYCPNCGKYLNMDNKVEQEKSDKIKSKKDKTTAAILSFVFGWLGIQFFYLDNNSLGILAVLLFWTGIAPLVFEIIGIIDGIEYLKMSDDEFDREFNSNIRLSKYCKPEEL